MPAGKIVKIKVEKKQSWLDRASFQVKTWLAKKKNQPGISFLREKFWQGPLAAPVPSLPFEEAALDRCFEELRLSLLEEWRRPTQINERVPLFIEKGHIGDGRAYFYIKPKDLSGWLFERSGKGWTVSRCEKIGAQDLFLRKGETVDVVAVDETSPREFPRVSSSILGWDPVSLRVYKQYMAREVEASLE
jgi:hypothetical protein